ncbi:hypothetical protein [Streptomyces shenzhenensis]|uniref:hypothetical protein n=1 Tax=Streptomyces shenzhenensis TaxID=943815 RepID=UPI001F4086CD|nr:hypothetical protein [Streptomyces shenzhenensis]
MNGTTTASAALRRTRAEPTGYTMELGLLNKGGAELTSWQALITLPEGASMVAAEGAAVEGGGEPHVCVVRPRPSRPLAPSDRQIATVEVRGTTRAPTAARFTAVAADGSTVKAPVRLMAVVIADGGSREADESTWPGSTGIDRGAAGIGVEVGMSEVGAGGGAGGGGGGGATTKFRLDIEWENDSGGGGGAGGGMNRGYTGPDAEEFVKAAQYAQGGAGTDGQTAGNWQQYQQKYQKTGLQPDPRTNGKATRSADARTDPLDEIKALSERVAKLEGRNP